LKSFLGKKMNHTFLWRWQWISISHKSVLKSVLKSAYFHFSNWVHALSPYCISSFWPESTPAVYLHPRWIQTSLILTIKSCCTTIKVNAIFKSVQKFKAFKYSKLPYYVFLIFISLNMSQISSISYWRNFSSWSVAMCFI